MLSTVIIDDEEAAIYVLVDLLSAFSSSFDIKIVGTASNFEDGVDLIKKTQPDIVFLDINMPGKNGLEIFNEFKNPHFKIIFCTAYQEYAIEVLKKSACGYLLKPIDFFELRNVLQKVTELLNQEQKQLQLEDKINVLNTPVLPGENIILSVDSGFIMENTRNIEYCYAKQSYSVIVTYTKKEILVSKSLKELQEILPESQFYRTHKSFLVNIYYIQKFVRANESYVHLENGVKIPVSVRISSAITNDIKKMIDSVKEYPHSFSISNPTR